MSDEQTQAATTDPFALADQAARQQFAQFQERMDALEQQNKAVLGAVNQLVNTLQGQALLPAPPLPPEKWKAVKADVASRCDTCRLPKMVWVNGRGDTTTHCANKLCSSYSEPDGVADLSNQQEIVTDSPAARQAQLVGAA